MIGGTRFVASLPALLALAACGSGHRLQSYGPVPDFELMSQTGGKVALADLKGKVWVADTVFTTCTGPCPMMSARMRRLALEFASVPNVRMVSFTVDPAHDTPEVLLEYSKHFPAAPNRWLFLTGQQSVLNRVSMDGLHLSHVDGSLDHSEEFVLVDANTVVRGFYFPFDKDRLKQLTSDIRFLAGS
jgi:protein SCO1/2